MVLVTFSHPPTELQRVQIKLAWAWVYMVSYWFGSVSPSSVNHPDYSRFGTNETAIWLGTIIALLVPTTLIPVFGVIGASTTEQLYGTQLWQPMEICDQWLRNNYSAGARAATFFCGLSFTLSQISYTISSSGFASGMDLAGVLPKYIDIKRGAIFCALVSVALQPWNFYNSSSTFLTVMSSFGIVMTPIIAVMIADNFLIRKRKYSISQGFVGKGSEYYFNKGFNWRAFVAWVCGMTPGLPGIAWQVNNNYFHNKGIINFFYGDSFFSFVISFFLYWFLCVVFPFEINILNDEKDYYGAFTEEVARKKGMVPYCEITEEELEQFRMDKVDVTYVTKNGSSDSSDEEFKEGAGHQEVFSKASTDHTTQFEIVEQPKTDKTESEVDEGSIHERISVETTKQTN